MGSGTGLWLVWPYHPVRKQILPEGDGVIMTPQHLDCYIHFILCSSGLCLITRSFVRLTTGRGMWWKLPAGCRQGCSTPVAASCREKVDAFFPTSVQNLLCG